MTVSDLLKLADQGQAITVHAVEVTDRGGCPWVDVATTVRLWTPVYQGPVSGLHDAAALAAPVHKWWTSDHRLHIKAAYDIPRKGVTA